MFTRYIGIDLGTTNVLIFVKGKGIVLNEPSLVAVNTESKEIIAVGKEAKEMLGRTPKNVQLIEPMKDGVIADFELAEVMLNNFINKIKGISIARPTILICCPNNITNLERRTCFWIERCLLINSSSLILSFKTCILLTTVFCSFKLGMKIGILHKPSKERHILTLPSSRFSISK